MEKPAKDSNETSEEKGLAIPPKVGPMGMSGGGRESGTEISYPTDIERMGTQQGSNVGQSDLGKRTEITDRSDTSSGAAQGTQSGGTTQTDRMNPGRPLPDEPADDAERETRKVTEP